MAAYQACKTPNAREDYARRWATRWSELSRLPYFDMCQMIAVDPMHNLFLGKLTFTAVLVYASTDEHA